MMILLMDLEVLRQVSYPLAQQGDLNLWRSGVGIMDTILFDDRLFLFRRKGQLSYSS
jgi:hypothetical protein